MNIPPFASYVQRFFTERLISQLRASPNTIASYRDTFRLMLRYASNQLGRPPTELQVADIDAEFVGSFLGFIENTRTNTVRTRNTRLSAIRSFFKYVSVNEPQLLHHCQRVLAMPLKRHETRPIDYLSDAEINAIIGAPNSVTWSGRRDQTLLMLALQTGFRVSELIHLSCGDVHFGVGAHIRCQGKGRKERATPLRKDCVQAVRAWMNERAGTGEAPLFVSNRGSRLSRDAIEQIVRKHVATAATRCPSLKKKRVSPHVLRHTAAMQLLQNGVDRTVIALWLGHESLETTQIYIHADIQLKEKAMALTKPMKARFGRYQPDDKLLSFLEAL